MIAEHRRPLAAFFLVAFVCALVVGNALRNATLQRLVDGGLPLGVLVPIAPDMLFTIDASGHNGRGGDLPYVGRAVVAVSRPATPTATVTPAVATVPVSSVTPVVRTVVRSAAGGSARVVGQHHAPSRRTPTVTSGSPAVAPGAGTPALTRGHGHGATPVAKATAKAARAEQKAAAHQLERARHAAAKATHRQAVHHKHVTRAATKHAAKPHHPKRHQKQHQQRHHPKH